MNNWESRLIDRIHPEVSRLWAVGDADGLFRSDKVARLLAECGAEVVLFEDPLMFRYFYEAEMRPSLEAGQEGSCYVVVLGEHPEGFMRLPADVYQACKRLEISLGDIFPNLSWKVLRELEPTILSRLWEKRSQIPGHNLSDNETADLVLRLCYRVEPTIIEQVEDIIRCLIELHFNGWRLPPSIATRLEQVCAGIPGKPMNLGELMREPARFWEFLQVEWETWMAGENLNEQQGLVPFADNRIRLFVDNLFTEGFLSPIVLSPGSRKLPAEWCRVGIATQSTKAGTDDLILQRDALETAIPEENASYQEWLRFANRYASHVAAWFAADRPQEKVVDFWDQFWTHLDKRFQKWVTLNLDGLHNLPPTRPVVSHHIPQFLSRKVAQGDKIVLLLMDGLSLSQWKMLRTALYDSNDEVIVDEASCFALLPSITNVCRQSIYSGELPVYFEASIQRTDLDGKRWKSFWDSAISRNVRSSHLAVQGQPSDLDSIKEALDQRHEALGITITMPDDMMHGATMGWHGLFEQLRLWASQPFFNGVISAALGSGYRVYVTSDHGNLEAVGMGNPSEGALVDRRGQRVRIYQDPTLRDHSASVLQGQAMAWHSKLLPQSYLPLIHTGRGAFTTPGHLLVCHGGASIDELVVPFIEFSRARHI